MGRIRPDDAHMKIEHWAPQEKRPDLQLDYRNMLGACRGGMGAPQDQQHCDAYKGSTEIKLDPTDTASGWEQSIQYSRADGKISSTNPDRDRELGDGALNLNLQLLKDARLAKWQGVKEAISRKHPGAWPDSVIQRYIDLYEGRDESGRYRDYCAVVVYFLRKRLTGSAAASP